MTGVSVDADRLAAAIAAASTLGIDTRAAAAARDAIVDRGGFPGDLYVLALAGGTGVGKSSLLNALAGTDVSSAGVRRPTTTSPLAWVPAERVSDARPLLEWLGGAELVIRPGAGDELSSSVAILDLPDLDSVDPGHAARVDAVLPRVDAVLWVSDPEKYADAVLHDHYLRRWLPRLGRQAFALNKTDRLASSDAQRLRDDLTTRLAGQGAPPMPILLTSAISDVSELRAWLAGGVQARAVVRERLDAAGSAAVKDLLRAAGLAGDTPPSPLVPPEARDRAVRAAAQAVLRVVDLQGLSDQAVAATQGAARGRGGGPLGVVRSLIDRGTGAQERHGDPSGYLLRWRERGALEPAAQPIRDLLTASLAGLPPSARPGAATLADTEQIAARLGRATDRAIAGPAGRFETPTSRVWPLIGVAQLVATGALAAGAIWLLTLWVSGGHAPTAAIEVPLAGPVPTPAVLVIGGLFAAFLLGRGLRWHAARLGRDWAARSLAGITAEVQAAVTDTALVPVAEWDQARLALWRAGRDTPAEG